MKIICLMGRSGSGKSSVEKVLEKLGYNRLVSYTTRKPREGEKHGREYYFVTEDEFKGLIEKEIIMEWATYNDNYYGSPHPIGADRHVVVMEPEGYRTIKSRYGTQVVGVYIDVPTEIAAERAYRRENGKSLEDIERRKAADDAKFEGIETEVELVVDGLNDTETIAANILKYMRDNA